MDLALTGVGAVLLKSAPRALIAVVKVPIVVRTVILAPVLSFRLRGTAQTLGIHLRRRVVCRWIRQRSVLDFLMSGHAPLTREDRGAFVTLLGVGDRDERVVFLIDALREWTLELLPPQKATAIAQAEIRAELRAAEEGSRQRDTAMAAQIAGVGEKVVDVHRDLVGLGAQRVLGAAVDVAERARSAERRGMPFSAHDPTALGVHRAVGAIGQDARRGAVLPAFLQRPHDDELRRAISGGDEPGTAPDRPVFVALWGASCRGKTRSAYEAISSSTVRDWDLVRPGSLEHLVDELERGIAPRSVLWLDDLEDLFGLGFTAGDEPVGRRAIQYLADLLTAPAIGGVLVVATMWALPTISETPGSASTNGVGPERVAARTNGIARLFQLAHTVQVEADFSRTDVEGAARTDAQFRHVVEQAGSSATRTGRIAASQYFAGAAHHLQRYIAADEAEHALITAAMELRRVGLTNPLPGDLVADVAREMGRSSSADPGTGVLEAALRRVSEEWRGTYALRAVRRPDGSLAYELHDFLYYSHVEQTRARPTERALWPVLVDHKYELGVSTLRAVRNDALARGMRHVAHLLADPTESWRPDRSGVGAMRTAESLAAAEREHARVESTPLDPDPDSDRELGLDREALFAAQLARGHRDRVEAAAVDSWMADHLLSAHDYGAGSEHELDRRAAAGSHSAEQRVTERLVWRGEVERLRARRGERNYTVERALAELFTATGDVAALRELAEQGVARTEYVSMVLARGTTTEWVDLLASAASTGEQYRILGALIATGRSADLTEPVPQRDIGEFRVEQIARAMDAVHLDDLSPLGYEEVALEQVLRAAASGDDHAIEEIAAQCADSGFVSLGWTHSDLLGRAVSLLLVHGRTDVVRVIAEERTDVLARLLVRYWATGDRDGLRALAADARVTEDWTLGARLGWALAALDEWAVLAQNLPTHEATIARATVTGDRAALERAVRQFSPSAEQALVGMRTSKRVARRVLRNRPLDARRVPEAALAAFASRGAVRFLERLGAADPTLRNACATYLLASGRPDRIASMVRKSSKQAGPPLDEWVLRVVAALHTSRDALVGLGRMIGPEDHGGWLALNSHLHDTGRIDVLRALGSDRSGALVERSLDGSVRPSHVVDWAESYVVAVTDRDGDAAAEREVDRGRSAGEAWASTVHTHRLGRRGDWFGVRALALQGEEPAVELLSDRLLLLADGDGLLELAASEHLDNAQRFALKERAVEVLARKLDRDELIARIGADRTLPYLVSSHLIEAGAWDTLSEALRDGRLAESSGTILRAAAIRGDLGLVRERADAGDPNAVEVLIDRATARDDVDELVRLAHFPAESASASILARATVGDPRGAPFTLDADAVAVPWLPRD